MWVTAVWIAMLLVVSISVYLINKRVREILELRHKRQALDEAERRVELQERENKVKLDAATANERTERKRQQLMQGAAEAQLAAKVAEAPETLRARIAEEEGLVTARAQAQAIEAKYKHLAKGYREFLGMGGYGVTFGDWVGSS